MGRAEFSFLDGEVLNWEQRKLKISELIKRCVGLRSRLVCRARLLGFLAVAFLRFVRRRMVTGPRLQLQHRRIVRKECLIGQADSNSGDSTLRWNKVLVNLFLPSRPGFEIDSTTVQIR